MLNVKQFYQPNTLGMLVVNITTGQSITFHPSYNSKINEASGNQKELFTILNKVLTVNKEPQLPSHTSLAELTDKFADFFISKILDIREQLKKSLRTPSLPTDQNDSQWNTTICLSNFEPAFIEEISKLIRDSPNKSCSLDPIPTWLTKKCIDVLAPLIMEIVNLSLSTGKMPDDYKNAVLIPLLKKISLDQEIFNNFRPISNLVYISKLIEKVIASRLHSHMTNNNLYEELQSSYRKFHSTETALTCVHDDILRAIDDNKSVLLITLDLSAAFDTVDHDVLLDRAQINSFLSIQFNSNSSWIQDFSIQFNSNSNRIQYLSIQFQFQFIFFQFQFNSIQMLCTVINKSIRI